MCRFRTDLRCWCFLLKGAVPSSRLCSCCFLQKSQVWTICPHFQNFSLPWCVHFLLLLPAAAVKMIFILCFSLQALETCQHCTASWHYPDQGDTNVWLWARSELIFFYLPGELVLGSVEKWLHNEDSALWDIYKETDLNPSVQWLILLLDPFLSSYSFTYFFFCACNSYMQKLFHILSSLEWQMLFTSISALTIQ